MSDENIELNGTEPDLTEDRTEEEAILEGLDSMDEDQGPQEEEKEDPQKQSEQKEQGQEEQEPQGRDRYTEQELLKIFDDILFSDEYQETYYIRGKHPVTFRTRTAAESNKIIRTIDGMNLRTIMAVNNHTNLLTMAYSLVQFGNKDFSKSSIKEKYEFLQNLPEQIINAISIKMGEFDEKVSYAMEEGERNF